jgi:outer membrane protein OmpA-like peptidoglycan-associated protein
VAGSDAGRDGPFEDLAATTLVTHARKDETTLMPATTSKAVRWVRVTLEGGILVERDKTFFEFSELMGYGAQATPPRSAAFTGKWKGRGVTLELAQDGAVVSGCYDGEGDLTGTVSGNLLHATGKTRKGDIPSAFVLAVGADKGIFGVSSTNGGRFRLYAADASPTASTECSGKPVAPIGCGSIIHGIQFDFDSAAIRPDSGAVLDALHAGLQDSSASMITVIGHTSSEGTDAYNDDLSKRRAQAVAAALAGRNIDSKRLAAEGRGEKQPIADNGTEAGRALNRRVEISCR